VLALLSTLFWLTRPGLVGSDDAALVLLARSMAEDGTFAVDRLVSASPIFDHLVRYGGHYMSDQVPGLAFVLALAYRFALAFGVRAWDPAAIAGFLTALTAAALGPLTYAIARRLGATPWSGAVGAAVVCLGSLLAVYAGTAFSHPIAAFLIGIYLLLTLDSLARTSYWLVPVLRPQGL
jgi:uncharacterized membrane protein (Fun14 family)